MIVLDLGNLTDKERERWCIRMSWRIRRVGRKLRDKKYDDPEIKNLIKRGVLNAL